MRERFRNLAPLAVDAVRVLKKWRNGSDWQGLKKPPSYFLELVVLRLGTKLKLGAPGHVGKAGAETPVPTLKKVLLEAFKMMSTMAVSPPKRRVFDVADSTNNVADRLSDPLWTRMDVLCKAELAQAAKSTTANTSLRYF